MNDVSTYPVHEVFHAFQGEGVHMGRSAFFIRLYGCPVHCPWCDSAGTWHPDWVPQGIRRASAKQVVEEIFKGPRPDIVVITGGEPTIFDLRSLCEELHGLPSMPTVHLETSGAFEIKGMPYLGGRNLDEASQNVANTPDWITVSPKRWRLPLDENLLEADELKFIIESTEDVTFYTDLYRQALERAGMEFGSLTTPIWLHPEWSHREDRAVLTIISETVKLQGSPFRAGWQLHKEYVVDKLDPRSRHPVPLGGEPAKGY